MRLLRCCRCADQLPESSFGIDRSIKRGRTYMCKACMSVDHKVRSSPDTPTCISCGERIPPHRSPNAKSCGAACARTIRLRAMRRIYTKRRVRYSKVRRESTYKRLYGMTIRKYESMLKRQGGGCAICGKKASKKRRLAVDHHHSKGVARGILCFMCNAAIGAMQDDERRFEAAAAYIRRAKRITSG